LGGESKADHWKKEKRSLQNSTIRVRRKKKRVG